MAVVVDREFDCSDSAFGIGGYVDVETTGLSHQYDEVIELALFLFVFHRERGEIKCIIDEYIGLREPKRPISDGAFRVHGIRAGDVQGKALDLQRLEIMIQRAEFLIAHNANFDYGFVRRLLPVCASKPWLCSMKGIKWREKGFASVSLPNLLAVHKIHTNRAHRAGNDVLAALNLLTQSYQGNSYFAELISNWNRARVHDPNR
jgi:DNA polymerase-3 subunit epsilon